MTSRTSMGGAAAGKQALESHQTSLRRVKAGFKEVL